MLTLLLCCIPESSPFGGIEVDNTDMHANQQAAQDHMVSSVEGQFGWNLDGVKTVVSWTTTTCEDRPAVVWDNRCFGGLTFACDLMFVPEFAALAETALSHELGHCFRMYAGVDPDRQHVDEEFWRLADTEEPAAWERYGW